jgi:hypothetical protein
MKFIGSFIKYSVLAICVMVLITVAFKLKSCFESEEQTGSTNKPTDPTFAATNEFNVKPVSTPFEKEKTPLVRIPAGMKGKDFAKAIRVIKKDSTGRKDTIGILITKDGKVLPENADQEIQEVDVANYVPPILDWGLHAQAGITFWDRVSPAIGIAPLEIEGCIQLPLLVADLYGLGVGAAYKRKEFSIGLLSHWGFLLERQIKLSLTYNF